MKIGIDILGGDFAPDANLSGAVLAKKELPGDVKLVLLGDRDQISSGLLALNTDPVDFEIVHAPDVITMHDHPTRAIPQKPNSSIAVGFDLLSKHEIQAFASTGNTGAMLVGAIYKINTIPGIIRPCITSTLPAIDGSKSILLDVGSNADCKADVLYQFAVLGALYAKKVYGVENPRVALLNIGEEESKGNLLTLAAHKLMAESDEINFIGNLEGRDLFFGKADVIVCDGFTGNVVIKLCEGMYYRLAKRGIEDEYLDKFNFKNYGGSLILGVNAPVVVGHGITKAPTFVKMVELAAEAVESGLTRSIQKAMKSFSTV